MAYWLMKSEPDVFSIEDLRRKSVAGWDGVRNYQARNNLRAMRKGDLALFFHSNAKPPAVAGLMEIVREAYPDPTADKPGWDQVDVQYRQTFAAPLPLEEIRNVPELSEMVLVKNSRLSVQPVREAEWRYLAKRLAMALAVLLVLAPRSWAACAYFRTDVKMRTCEVVDPKKMAAQNPYQDDSEAAVLLETQEGPLVEVSCDCDYSLRGSDVRCDLDQTIERRSLMSAEKPKELCRQKKSLCKKICPNNLPD